MPLTAAQLQNLIPIEIGDTGIVAQNLAALWAKHDNRVLWLQYLWTKRDAIQMLMGSVWQDYTVRMASGEGLNLKEKYDNLSVMYKQVSDEITAYRGNRSPVIGQITAQSPIESPSGQPDANSTKYMGDPNTRSNLRWPQ